MQAFTGIKESVLANIAWSNCSSILFQVTVHNSVLFHDKYPLKLEVLWIHKGQWSLLLWTKYGTLHKNDAEILLLYSLTIKF